MKKPFRVRFLKKVDSTNLEVRRMIRPESGSFAVVALEQTEGRGQGDHKWSSRPCENITMSLHLPLELDVRDADLISCATTLGIRDYLLSQGVPSRIKLPNDIWFMDRKICGILIENILEGSVIRHTIIGVGLNLNQLLWPSDIPNPISLSLITGNTYDLPSEASLLLAFLRRRFDHLHDTDRLRSEFSASSFTL